MHLKETEREKETQEKACFLMQLITRDDAPVNLLFARRPRARPVSLGYFKVQSHLSNVEQSRLILQTEGW